MDSSAQKRSYFGKTEMASQIPEEIHIHHCMLLEFHKGSNATVAKKNICDMFVNAKGDFSKFKSGNFDLSGSHRSGRTTTLDNDVIKGVNGSKSVSDNRTQHLTNTLNALNQPWSTIQEHVQRIGKTKRVDVWVPHNLFEENRANRYTTSNLLLQRYYTEPFLDRLITADEKWVLYDNPKRRSQWLSPKEPPRRTAKPGLHPKKALFCIWWGIRGIVHFEVLKPEETVNADLYCGQLDRLNQSLIEKYPAIFNRNGAVLQHDSAIPHCT
ncbi:UNVERIFIED_CONTAM: Histone-lysine N-methyltransferase SETMAR [Trichonephila clavipes]